MKKANLKIRLKHYIELIVVVFVLWSGWWLYRLYQDTKRVMGVRAQLDACVETNQALGKFNDQAYTELLKATKDACEGKYIYLKVDELGEKEGKGK